MDRIPPQQSAGPRFGLGKQAALTAGFFVAAVAAATVLAHVLQWESSSILRREADRDLPGLVAACRVLEHAAECSRLQRFLESSAGQKESRQESLDAWSLQLAGLEDQVKVLAAKNAFKDEKELAEWKAAIDRYRTQLLAWAQAVETGSLTSDAAHDGLKTCETQIQKLMNAAENLVVAIQDRLKANNEELLRVTNSRMRLVNVRSVVAVLIMLTAVFWFRRVVLGRLKEISALVSRIAAGELDARLESASADELGVLASQCNDVAAAIQSTQHDTRRAKETADAVSRAKREWIANVSQEMSVSLSVISVQTDMLLASPDSSQRLEAAQTIKHNSEYLLEVVHGVSSLTKIEAGDLRIERSACSPAQVVHEVAGVLRSRAESKGLQLIASSEGPIPDTVETDSARLRQILFILVSSAIKCNDVGEIRLTVRHADHTDRQSRLEFEVVPGAKMTPHQIEQLSSPAAGDSSEEQQITASGVNMAVCRRLIDMLNGAIRVDMAWNGETVMILAIPTPPVPASRVAEPAPRKSPPPKVAVPGPLPKPAGEPRFRILLAEDGPENRRLIAMILSKAGADVTMAENGQEAVGMALSTMAGKEHNQENATEPFDLILMDMQMPVMDGYEATRRLRQNGYSGLIVAVTGHTRSFDRQKCLDAGCNDYLAKPLDREKLLAMVSEHVACRSRHRHIGI